MAQNLSLDDLFTVGLGFEFAGAFLLGRGLLTSPGVSMRRASPRWNFHAGIAVAQAEDRVDAEAGVVALLVGFAIQALGYALVLREGTARADWPAAVVAGLLAIVVACFVLALWFALGRGRRLRVLLIEFARYDQGGERHTLPSGQRLREFGMELGIHALATEVDPGGTALYASRVFGVDEARPDADVTLET
jgi:hypothetical protein